MDLETAKKIFANPKRHNRIELLECLKVLNAQPHTLTVLELLAFVDAHRGLK